VLLDDLTPPEGPFRDRCLQWIEERRGSTTIVLASRDAALLHRLCSEGILLESGRLLERGTIETLVRIRDERLRTSEPPASQGFSHLGAILAGRAENPDGLHQRRFRWDEDVVVRIDLEVQGAGEAVRCGLRLRTGRKAVLSARQPEPFLCHAPGVVAVRARIPAGTLASETYSVDADALITDGGLPIHMTREGVVEFDVGNPPEVDQIEGADPDPPEEEVELVEAVASHELDWTVEAEDEPA